MFLRFQASSGSRSRGSAGPGTAVGVCMSGYVVRSKPRCVASARCVPLSDQTAHAWESRSRPTPRTSLGAQPSRPVDAEVDPAVIRNRADERPANRASRRPGGCGRHRGRGSRDRGPCHGTLRVSKLGEFRREIATPRSPAPDRVPPRAPLTGGPPLHPRSRILRSRPLTSAGDVVAASAGAPPRSNSQGGMAAERGSERDSEGRSRELPAAEVPPLRGSGSGASARAALYT